LWVDGIYLEARLEDQAQCTKREAVVAFDAFAESYAPKYAKVY
jgi:hypothetical protein